MKTADVSRVEDLSVGLSEGDWVASELEQVVGSVLWLVLGEGDSMDDCCLSSNFSTVEVVC